MSKSGRLTLGHIRSAFRLVGEADKFGPGGEQYLTGLLRLTGAQVAMGGDALVADGQLLIPGALDLGWPTASDRSVYQNFMAAGLCYQEPTGHVTLAAPDAVWTRARRHLIADREYYRSVGYQARREGHNGDYLHSCRPWAADGVICMLQLNRALGDRPFTPIELKLVHLVQDELAIAREGWRTRRRSDLTAGLSRRERQVLDLLLAGYAEKRVATELGISGHTAHQYVKALYVHFGVHSRAELLARWVRP